MRRGWSSCGRSATARSPGLFPGPVVLADDLANHDFSNFHLGQGLHLAQRRCRRRDRFDCQLTSGVKSITRFNTSGKAPSPTGGTQRAAGFEPQPSNLVLDVREGFELAISPTRIFAELLTSVLPTTSPEVRRKEAIRERF